MTFQKVLFDIALSHQPLESIAEQVGIRREAIWRNQNTSKDYGCNRRKVHCCL
jgi:biotin operon repressor